LFRGYKLTCSIRNLTFWARGAIKAAGSLSLLRGFPEFRVPTLTAKRVRSLNKIRHVLVIVQTFI
jgi:hypothetical protein